MKAAEWFIVGVRLIGVWLLVQAAIYVMTFVDVFFEMAPQVQGDMRSSSVYLFHAFAQAILSVCLLFGAPRLAKFFFREPEKPRYADDEDDELIRSVRRDDLST